MAVYSPGNPFGAEKDFKIMEQRAENNINSLPLVMKSQVGGYLFGKEFGREEDFIVKNVSSSAKLTSNKVMLRPGPNVPTIKPITRSQGGNRLSEKKSNYKLGMMGLTRRNRKNGGGIFGDSMTMTSSDEGFMDKKIPTTKPMTKGGRRTMRKGKGSAASWAKAVTKYYKDQKKTRKALKFSDALKEAAKLKKAGKLMY